jgi:hypothetical protein
MTNFSFNLSLLFIFSLWAGKTVAQENSYVSADSLVQMEVKRDNKSISVALIFKADDHLDRLVIERSAQSSTGFTQCKYLKTNNSASDVITLDFRDLYASYISEYYYRLKTISTDGVERIYPPLRLRALAESSTP